MVRHRVQQAIAIIVALMLSVAPSAHEVPIHQAISDKAVGYLVQSRRDLPELALCAPHIKEMLRQGVKDEDDDFSVLTPGLGRYYFHFLPHLSDLADTTLGQLLVNATCNSDIWGRNGNNCEASVQRIGAVDPGEVRVTVSNEQSYDQMVADLHNTPGSGLHDRGLIGLGHYLHLLQDLSSPPHARNDAHPHIPAMGSETGRELGDPSLFELLNANRGSEIGSPTGPLLDGNWASPRDAFLELQQKTASRFWSEKNTLGRSSVGVPDGPVATPDPTLDGYARDSTGRRIAHQVFWTFFPPKFTINDVVARAQFDELAPVAVLYTASMINYIMTKEHVNLCPPVPAVFERHFSLGDESRESYVVEGNVVSGTRERFILNTTVRILMTITGIVTSTNDPVHPGQAAGTGTYQFTSGDGTVATVPFNWTGGFDVVPGTGNRFFWTSPTPSPYTFGTISGLGCTFASGVNPSC